MKTATFIAGSPLVYQAAVAMQDGLKDAILSLALPYGNVRLSGCIDSTEDFVNSLSITTSEGWVLLAGEPMYMPAQSYTQPSAGSRKFVVYKQTATTNYPEADSDGITRQMVVNNTAAIKAVATSYTLLTGEAWWSEVVTMPKKLNQLVTSDNLGWWRNVGEYSLITVSGEAYLTEDFTNGDGSAPVINWRYRKIGDNMQFSGAVLTSEEVTGPTTLHITTLPEGYRPAVRQFFPVSVGNEVNTYTAMLWVLTDGFVGVRVQSGISLTGMTVYLSNITIPLT
jgi:hypothetical protein